MLDSTPQIIVKAFVEKGATIDFKDRGMTKHAPPPQGLWLSIRWVWLKMQDLGQTAG